MTTVNSQAKLFAYLAAYQATVGAYEAWDLALDPAYLAAVGLSCALISTSRAVGFLPFLCKFAFSFISDRFNFFGWGWRRPYITLGLVCSAVCFFILTAIPPRESFALYVIVSVLRNSAISLADGGAEGLSVDAGVEASSGALQAWSMAGRALGMMLWAAAGGYIAERSGYAACLAAVGAFVLCCVPGGWFVKEERQALRSSAEGYVAAEADRFVNVSAAAEPSEPRGGPVFSTAALTASFLPAVVLPEPTAPAYETGIKGPQAESIYPAPQQQLPTGSHADATRAYVQFDGPGRLTETAGGMTFSEQARVVFMQTQDPAITCFLAWTFLSTLGVFIAAYPLSPCGEIRRGFSAEEVGWLTFVSATGSLILSLPAGFLFDSLRNKRYVLAAATACAGAACLAAFGLGRAVLFATQFFVSAGVGALYTVQASSVRIFADERVGASMFGVTFGTRNAAALLGTLLGGVIADNHGGDSGSALCFVIGAVLVLASGALLRWVDLGAVYEPPESQTAAHPGADGPLAGVGEVQVPLLDVDAAL